MSSAPSELSIPSGRAAATGRSPAASDGMGEQAARVTGMSREFEKLLSGMLVGAMVPAKQDSTFGKGLAGDVFRQFLVEAVADAIVRGDSVGLSKGLGEAWRRTSEGGAPHAKSGT